jgi:hypothetical protein
MDDGLEAGINASFIYPNSVSSFLIGHQFFLEHVHCRRLAPLQGSKQTLHIDCLEIAISWQSTTHPIMDEACISVAFPAQRKKSLLKYAHPNNLRVWYWVAHNSTALVALGHSKKLKESQSIVAIHTE